MPFANFEVWSFWQAPSEAHIAKPVAAHYGLQVDLLVVLTLIAIATFTRSGTFEWTSSIPRVRTLSSHRACRLHRLDLM
eukprot:3476733-Amphidinium_carterae.3